MLQFSQSLNCSRQGPKISVQGTGIGTGRCLIPLESSNEDLMGAIHEKVEREALRANQDFLGKNIQAQ